MAAPLCRSSCPAPHTSWHPAHACPQCQNETGTCTQPDAVQRRYREKPDLDLQKTVTICRWLEPLFAAWFQHPNEAGSCGCRDEKENLGNQQLSHLTHPQISIGKSPRNISHWIGGELSCPLNFMELSGLNPLKKCKKILDSIGKKGFLEGNGPFYWILGRCWDSLTPGAPVFHHFQQAKHIYIYIDT